MKTINSAMLWGPFWFCGLILFAGALTPAYSHSTQAVSELAAPGAAYAGLVRFGGFVPLGLIFVVFGLTLRKPNAKAFPTILFVLFIISGLAIIAAGVFPTDVHGRRNSFSGMAHAVAGVILLVSLCATPLAAAFSSAAGSRSFRIYSGLSGLALITLFALLPNGISPALIQLQKAILGDFFTTWYQYQGIDQRALLLIYFAWLFVFVWRSPE